MYYTVRGLTRGWKSFSCTRSFALGRDLGRLSVPNTGCPEEDSDRLKILKSFAMAWIQEQESQCFTPHWNPAELGMSHRVMELEDRRADRAEAASRLILEAGEDVCGLEQLVQSRTTDAVIRRRFVRKLSCEHLSHYWSLTAHAIEQFSFESLIESGRKRQGL